MTHSHSGGGSRIATAFLPPDSSLSSIVSRFPLKEGRVSEQNQTEERSDDVATLPPELNPFAGSKLNIMKKVARRRFSDIPQPSYPWRLGKIRKTRSPNFVLLF